MCISSRGIVHRNEGCQPHEEGTGPNGTFDHFTTRDALVQGDGGGDPLEKDTEHVLTVKKGGRYHVEDTQRQREGDEVLQIGFKPGGQKTRQKAEARVEATYPNRVCQPKWGLEKAERLGDILDCAGMHPIMQLKKGKIG